MGHLQDISLGHRIGHLFYIVLVLQWVGVRSFYLLNSPARTTTFWPLEAVLLQSFSFHLHHFIVNMNKLKNELSHSESDEHCHL
jgi:hypothetical protein